MKRYEPKDGIDEFQIRKSIAFANYLYLRQYCRDYIPLDLYKNVLNIHTIRYNKEV